MQPQGTTSTTSADPIVPRVETKRSGMYWINAGIDRRNGKTLWVHPWSIRARQIERERKKNEAMQIDTGDAGKRDELEGSATRQNEGLLPTQLTRSGSPNRVRRGDSSPETSWEGDAALPVTEHPLISTPTTVRTTKCHPIPSLKQFTVPQSSDRSSLPSGLLPLPLLDPASIPSTLSHVSSVPQTSSDTSIQQSLLPLQSEKPESYQISSSSVTSIPAPISPPVSAPSLSQVPSPFTRNDSPILNTSDVPHSSIVNSTVEPPPVHSLSTRKQSSSGIRSELGEHPSVVGKSGAASGEKRMEEVRVEQYSLMGDGDDNSSEETNYSDAPVGRANSKKRSSKTTKTKGPLCQAKSSATTAPAAIQPTAPNTFKSRVDSTSPALTVVTPSSAVPRSRRSTHAPAHSSLPVEAKPTTNPTRNSSARLGAPRSSSSKTSSKPKSTLPFQVSGLSLSSSFPTRPPSNSSSTPFGSRGLFSSTVFLITTSTSFIDSRRTKLTKQINEAGGSVVDYSDLFVFEMDESTRELRIRFETIKFPGKKVILLSDSVVMTPKYLVAVALGIPCCSIDYVNATISKTSPIQWSSHLLPGSPRVSKDFDLASLAPVHGGGCFSNKSFLFVQQTTIPPAELNSQNYVRLSILACCSASRIDFISVPSKSPITKDSLSALSSAIDSSPYDYVLFERFSSNSQNLRSLETSLNVCKQVVTLDWIKKCLLAGTIVETE